MGYLGLKKRSRGDDRVARFFSLGWCNRHSKKKVCGMGGGIKGVKRRRRKAHNKLLKGRRMKNQWRVGGWRGHHHREPDRVLIERDSDGVGGGRNGGRGWFW